jgi:hypothetical protein
LSSNNQENALNNFLRPSDILSPLSKIHKMEANESILNRADIFIKERQKRKTEPYKNQKMAVYFS